jgi:putative AdoMet-dependent methyltransferase
VLDLGVGTGNLAARFATLGCQLWVTDYSSSMLNVARRKLPEARLVQHDLRHAWPPELDRRFDRIVSSYALHHFELETKVQLMEQLVRRYVARDGWVTIGDLSFASARSMDEFAVSIGDAWEVEPYWLADEAEAALKQAGLRSSYRQVSPCAGVYKIESG